MADIKLTVRLHESKLNGMEGKYTGIVSHQGTIDNEALADYIAAERTDLRPETIRFMLIAADAAKRKLLKQGFVIADGLGTYQTTISGTFAGETSAYDKAHHAIGIAFAPGSDLLDELSEIEVDTKPGTSGRVVNSVFDVASQTHGMTITPSGPLFIYGKQLRIVGDNPSNGVYFVGADGTEHRVTTIGHNTPSTLMVIVPPLAAGRYRLKIITQCGTHGKTNKTAGTCEYDTPLTVQ